MTTSWWCPATLPTERQPSVWSHKPWRGSGVSTRSSTTPASSSRNRSQSTPGPITRRSSASTWRDSSDGLVDRVVIGHCSTAKQQHLEQHVEVKEHKQDRRENEEPVKRQIDIEHRQLERLFEK